MCGLKSERSELACAQGEFNFFVRFFWLGATDVTPPMVTVTPILKLKL